MDNPSKPVDLPKIRNITISGRIASGTTTLAKGLAQALGWEVLEGGELFKKIHDEMNLSEVDVHKRPDSFDLEYEEKIKGMLKDLDHQIIQSHLSGFDAKDIPGVYKILVVCENHEGIDMQDIRIDRLVNRRGISVEDAKNEVRDREQNNLDKWRRLYANNDSSWVYYDPKYYDLVVNTYSHDKENSLKFVLEHLGFSKS
jgi:cytidylate kinase